MNFKEKIYFNFAKLMPKQYRNTIKQLFIYSGIHSEKDLLAPTMWLGRITTLATLVLIIIILTPISLFATLNYIYILSAIVSFILIQFIFYILLQFRVQARTNIVEEYLPDVLQLTASNLKAGMTPYLALKNAQRKEFGPLSEEIDHATKRAFGTESFTNILNDISKRIKSDLLNRSLKLFSTSLRSGGKSAKVLEELSNDIAETRQLKKELMSATKTYSMFIMFTIIIGAPLLLAIAIQFITIITDISSSVQTSTDSFGLGLFNGQIAISTQFLFVVSIILLVVTGILAGMLLGVIKEGKVKEGFRYSPLIISGSLIVFFIARYIIGTLF